MMSSRRERYAPSRTSTPSATRWMGCSERMIRSAKVGMSVVGRLSTQKNPMSSKHLIAKLLPAPLSPVMTTNDRGAVITPRPSALPGREPALVRGQDAELLAVLGDRPPRDRETPLLQGLGDFLIGLRLGRVL